jgi:hypothetical protein
MRIAEAAARDGADRPPRRQRRRILQRIDLARCQRFARIARLARRDLCCIDNPDR